jgi:septal ring factor EnvC (AmiA/AmiB activator)
VASTKRLTRLSLHAVLIGVCLTVTPAGAEIKAAVQLANKSDDLKQEIRDLQVSFTGLARRVRDHETALASAERTLATLETEEASKLAELDRRRVEHYRTLAALQRIAVMPKAAVVITTEEPVDALRGALLLKAALPALEERASKLKQVLEELGVLRLSIVDERQALAKAAVALKERRQEVSSLIVRKKSLLAITEEEQKRAIEKAAKLAKQAENLRELMALAARDSADRPVDEQTEIDGPSTAEATGGPRKEDNDAVSRVGQQQTASLQRPDTVRSFPEEPGNILLPVHGDIVLRYGERVPSDSGQDATLKGIKIRTRPGADVIAPFDGKVVFSGNFRSYGQILIIDHGGRYHTLLAGLHRIRAVVGQWVLAGEPVATMDPQGSKEPELYLELRRTGQPINPLPWLAEGEQRARG